MSTIAFRTRTESLDVVSEVRRFPGVDPIALAEVVIALQESHGFPKAIVDSIGLGDGPYRTIRKKSRPVEGFVAGEATKVRDLSNQFGFVNKRALAWWNMREMLSPAFTGDPVALPPDDKLRGDLVAPKWREVPGGRIQIESKDEIRKRIGRSTDDGDAVVMVMLDRNAGSGAMLAAYYAGQTGGGEVGVLTPEEEAEGAEAKAILRRLRGV
jgi:hypothetical protein